MTSDTCERLEQTIQFAVEHLPADWAIDISICNQGVLVQLYDPNQDKVEVSSDWCSLELMIMDRIEKARKLTGMPEVIPPKTGQFT